MIDSHTSAEIISTLEPQPLEVREQVEEVSVEMWGGFPKVIEQGFPNTVIVIDRFHVMKAVNDELNKICKQVGMFQRGSKFLLLKNGKDLSHEETQKLELILQQSKRSSKAYQWKEDFRAIYRERLLACFSNKENLSPTQREIRKI